jgi:hypothetical protein
MITRTAKEDLQHWDNILDEYESSIALPKYSPQYGVSETEINQYLTMTRDEIEKISPEDCAQISYRLAQFSFHVQRTINREIARCNWSEESIKDAIADEINNYKGYGFVEKSLQAIKHNDKASALNSIKKYAKQRIDRLSYIAISIKNLSDIMMAIQKTKVQHGSK